MSSPLVQLFLEAVHVDALSLHERPMVQFIRASLEGLPITITEDHSASLINGDCGNLICVPHLFRADRPAIALIAHMDTPRSTAAVKPLLTDGKIASDGTTALGVDNRAGASVLIDLLRNHSRNGAEGNFVVVFTVAEEIGMYGSKHLDLRPYNVRRAFVFDCSKRPGTFIQSAVGSSLYTVTFVGKSSHAGVAPEKGINAIQLAARALSQIPMGRLSPRMTSNAGMISGGEATNVVPPRCRVEGEVRAFQQEMIDEHVSMIEGIFRSVAEKGGGSIEFETHIDFPPFVIDSSSEIFTLTCDVLRSAGLVPEAIEYLGGSDANMLNNAGLPTVNLGVGAQNPHANEEFILLEDLEKTAEIARALIAKSIP